MRGVSKKMFISILTSVIVFVTMVATTFAWVGIFTYANTENFSFNLKVSELDVNYFLTISATGKKDDFSDTADIYEIKKDILKNQSKWTDSVINELSKDGIDSMYAGNNRIEPSTCIIDEEGNISDFKTVNYKNTYNFEYLDQTSNLKYLKFDLYLSVNTKEGIQDSTEVNSNVFLSNIANTLAGSIGKQKLINGNPFKKMPSIDTKYQELLSLPDNDSFKVNSSNAVRFALCLYDPINIDDEYIGLEKPNKTYIYQGGSTTPNKSSDIYDLGGILPEEYNTALNELLIIRPNYNSSPVASYNDYYYNCLNKAIERGNNDLELTEENSTLWSKPSNVDTSPYLGVHNGIQTKMKITVYFWFEGWDSDCLVGIDQLPVTMNLTFTSGVDD